MYPLAQNEVALIEIIERQNKFFSKTPKKIVFCLKTKLDQKRLLLWLLNEIKLENQVFNYRGRPAESFNHRQKNLPENSEELANIYGKSDHGLEFCYVLNTIFSNYADNGKIVHELKSKALGILKPYQELLDVTRVCSWMPLKIYGFRLGIESYSKFFLGSMIGAVPSIDSRFYIESENENTWVLVESSKSIFSHILLNSFDKFLNSINLNLIRSLKDE